MREFVLGVCIVLSAWPAYGSCRKRFKVVKQVVVQQVVQPVYVSPVVYQQAAPVQVQAAALQPVYVQQQAAHACCCCCPPAGVVGHPATPLPPVAGDPPPPAPAGSPDDAAIQEIVTRACVSCHGETSPKAGLSLVNVSLLTAEQAKQASLRIMLGEMPPQHPEVITDEQAQQIMRWAKGK